MFVIFGFREIRERFLALFFDERLHHHARVLPGDFRSDARRDRHYPGLYREDNGGQRVLVIRDGDHRRSLTRELHLAEIGLGSEQANALRAFTAETVIWSRDGAPFEHALEVSDVPEHAFDGIVTSARNARHALLHELLHAALVQIERARHFADVDSCHEPTP